MKVHDSVRAGSGFQDLDDEDRDRILSTRLNVNVVGSSVVDSELLEIFRRMNTYGARLNAQELRNANFSGLFKEVSYRTSAETLDYWLRWDLFNRQQVAEMQDVEFTSDLFLLLLRGPEAATKPVLDKAYRDYDETFDELEPCLDRFVALRETVDAAYASRESFPRAVSKMWTYSLFDALQRATYGGPLSETGERQAKRVARSKIVAACTRVQKVLEAERRPAAIERATRGAASDRASREARARYMLRMLSRK
jgi:hypothetical protein